MDTVNLKISREARDKLGAIKYDFNCKTFDEAVKLATNAFVGDKGDKGKRILIFMKFENMEKMKMFLNSEYHDVIKNYLIEASREFIETITETII
jgi:hypothetical protein